MLRAFGGVQCVAVRGFALAVLLSGSLLRAERAPVVADHGMVASASSLASEAGAAVLRSGGNAVDACVATALVLQVTYPRAGNLGGGGFMLIRLADGRSVALDFRETAPAKAARDMFLDGNGAVVPHRSTRGHLANGIPGTVAGLADAWMKYGSGRKTWAELVEPARRLAEDGFAATPALVRDIAASRELLSNSPDSVAIYLRGGQEWKSGEPFVQPQLAATFRRLQEKGPREFYEGETARLIVEDQARNGGLITFDDLRNYRVIERPVLVGQYRGYTVLTMPPPSSGGIALLQMLGMIEPRAVNQLPVGSADRVHLFVEVMRRAFRDRSEYLGDPDFVKVPVAELLDPAYLRRRMEDFDPARASVSTRTQPGLGPRKEGTDTTHVSVIDAEGNAVAMTYTLNGLFGNGVTVPGAGFLLNNEMDDFAADTRTPNAYGLVQGAANAVAPGKRPLSSMTPTVVLKDGRPVLVTGSPGGPTIITTVFFVITGVVDYGLNIADAAALPRFHHQWLPDRIRHEPGFLADDQLKVLKSKGHELTSWKVFPNAPDELAYRWGDAETIGVDSATGRKLGASDPRSPDAAAVGY